MDEELRYERAHLKTIQQIARTQAAELRKKESAYEEQIVQAQQGLGEEAVQRVHGSLWGSDAFEQLVELSQFATQISIDISLYENIADSRKKLEAMVNVPYFARIDFTYRGEDTPLRIYIGRHALMEKNDLLVHDWRAPVASMFYRYGLGEASFTAPSGVIHGAIGLKRQFEIQQGGLVYYIDADVEILDAYLRRLLSQNASPQMKAIVETIQREQDMVIRDMAHDVLAVQGAAGSGKTSVALHRIAYLLYRGLEEHVSSQDVVILSPNTVFEQYIETVLPELGEEHVRSFLLEELLQALPGMPRIRGRYAFIEAMLLAGGAHAAMMQQSIAYKCSEAFSAILDGLALPGGGMAGVLAGYRALFESDGGMDALAAQAGVALPEGWAAIAAYTRENLQSSTLSFDDASAIAYLYASRYGLEAYGHIRQVVIDEAQDYYYLQYAFLKALFPQAKYTVLGDIHQTVRKQEDTDFYNNVLQALGKRRSTVVTLEKSFRCTNEIIQFAAAVLGCEIESFGRPGKAPVLVRLRDERDISPLVADVQACLQEGYASICILCKTANESRRLYDLLKRRMAVKLIRQDDARALTGVCILPVYLSKGLEFDAAFLYGADAARYGEEADKSMLFIGCTRALHVLRLYVWGEVSPFLNKNAIPLLGSTSPHNVPFGH